MIIHSSRPTPQSLQVRPAQTDPNLATTREQESTDNVSFSLKDSSTFRSLSADAMYLGGAAGAVGAGMAAAKFLPSGMSGLSGALTGIVTGSLTGGVTGFALASGSQALWPSDPAGDGMMKGILSAGGAIVGGIAGGVSGYFGAQPMLVAPAAVAGGTATTLALGFARDALIH